MSSKFNKRVFGAVILKSINSNFNADFTHHPRTLPDGVVYSTDKALKYAIKDFIRKNYPKEKLFYVRRKDENEINALSLKDNYEKIFDKVLYKGKNKKIETLRDIIKCYDIRLFGATFVPQKVDWDENSKKLSKSEKDKYKMNISIHGPLQINHGVNKFTDNEIYSEDILSPFRNEGKDGKEEKAMSTIGNQTNLKEGHYVFHFSLNPYNLEEIYELTEEETVLSESDIAKLKEAMLNGVTALDSSRKIGTENEALIWVELNEGSKKMLPSFTDSINVKREGDIVEVDCSLAANNLNAICEDIEKVEFYYNPVNTKVTGLNLDKKITIENYNLLNNTKL